MPKAPETLLVRGLPAGGTRPCDIEIQNGIIRRIRPAGRTAPGAGSEQSILGPPLFDAQVNGICGLGLQGPNVSVDDVLAMNAHLRQQGVAYWIPTLVTASLDAMEHGCSVLAAAMDDPAIARAVPGIHLEGPWISPEDGPRGAHPKAHVRPPSLKEFNRLMKAAHGRVLYVTLAPERPGAVAFIRALTQRGVRVSLGHHAAGAAQIAAAAEAGASLSTHLGNGAASMIHRHQNPLWPQLAEDRLTASLIADLHHLPAETLKTFFRAKSPERCILVSDCTRIAGLPPGEYDEFGAAVELKPNGRLCLSGTDLLAGSAMMLIEGVLNAWRAAGITLEQAFACASAIPARFFGVRLPPATLREGRKAHFLAVRPAETARGGRPELEAVFMQGRRIV